MKRFEKYEVVGELGRGGMGVVYRGRSPRGGDVAIKLLSRQGRVAVERFRREERLLLEFTEDEGFVPILDLGEVAEGPYFVMGFYSGGTLRNRIDAGPLPVADVIGIARALAGAIGIAHARGIVHRDLKPENVLFTSHGRPLVADLGLAKHFRHDLGPGVLGDQQSLSLSLPGVLLGTAGYMSYEQLQDAKSAGPPADVFALGVVLYECLAGRQPFEGDTIIEQIARVESGTFPPLRATRPEVPAWLERIVARALARSLEARYRDGRELERALASGPASEAPTLDAPRSDLAFRTALTSAGTTIAESSPRPAAVAAPVPPTATLVRAGRWRLGVLLGACGVLAFLCLGSAGVLTGLAWLGNSAIRDQPGYGVGIAAAHASPQLREYVGGDFQESSWITSSTEGTSPDGEPTFTFELQVTGPRASGVLTCATCTRKSRCEVVSESFFDEASGKRLDVAPVSSQGR